MQSILRTSKNQVKIVQQRSLCKEFISNPVECIKSKYVHFQPRFDFIGYMMMLDMAYGAGNIHPSLFGIGRKIKRSRRTAFTIVKESEDLGILCHAQRFNSSNKYGLNTEFKSREMLIALKEVIPYARRILGIILMNPFGALAREYAAPPPIEQQFAPYPDKSGYIIYSTSTIDAPNLFSNRCPEGPYIPFYDILAPPDDEPMVEIEKIGEKAMNLPRVKRLTDEARVYLSAYPLEIVDEALEKVDRIPGIQNKIKWLMSHCSSLCKQRGITPSWGLAKQLKEKTVLSDNPPIYKPSAPVSDSPKKVVQSKPRTVFNRSPATPEQMAAFKRSPAYGFLEELRLNAVEREKGIVHDSRATDIRHQGGSDSSRQSTSRSSQNVRFSEAAEDDPWDRS